MNERASDVVTTAYNLLLDRDPEPAGLKHWSSALESGMPRAEFVRAILASAEFRAHMTKADALTNYEGVDVIVPIGEYQFRLPAADLSVVPQLLAHRCWEPHVMAFLTRTLQPDSVFVDVGANLGYFTVLCARMAGRVVAFEPGPAIRAYCARNVELNELTNVELHPYALWHEDTTLRFKIDSSCLGSSAVVVSGDEALEEVRAATLDGLVRRGCVHLPRLDVLKMDIEGAEMSALRGMRDTLVRCRPGIIMEVNRPALASLDTSLDEVWAFLKGLEYDIRAFEHWSEREPIRMSSLDDLKTACPPDSLIDIVAEPRAPAARPARDRAEILSVLS